MSLCIYVSPSHLRRQNIYLVSFVESGDGLLRHYEFNSICVNEFQYSTPLCSIGTDKDEAGFLMLVVRMFNSQALL